MIRNSICTNIYKYLIYIHLLGRSGTFAIHRIAGFSGACCFRHLYAERVPLALIAAVQLGRGVAALILDLALVNFGAAGQASEQGIAKEKAQ